MNYIPFNIKTHYTLLSSMITIENLITYAKNNNVKVLAISDSNMYGVIEFYNACKKSGIKPIIGLEVNIENNPILLYAKNYNGYKNLIKINTPNSANKLTIKILQRYFDDLICIVPFQSLSLYYELEHIFRFIFKGYKNENERNQLTGTNLIYINEILYLEKGDIKYFEYLLSIKKGIIKEEIKSKTNNNYLKSYENIKEKYKNDFKNNELINELCNVELKFQQSLVPKYNCPNNYDSYSYLKKLCIKGLKDRFGNEIPRIYIDRINKELNVIKQKGFCDYFLIVQDYVNFAKTKGILVGPGRGSAAGSLISYLLKITDVDPIKYNLYFERFLNVDRISMPDIDVDFEYDRREEVINYCINKYGNMKVAQIITFGTMGAKQVIRDVGRTMNIELSVIDHISRMINPKFTLWENYKKNKQLQSYLKGKPKLIELYNVSVKLEGLKRHTSVHAAGIVMSNIKLDEIIPIDNKHEEFYTTAYTMDYLEQIGLLKMDFLGLKNLTLINNIITDIQNNLKIDITFDNIPLDDEKALNIFKEVNTTGIFQFESEDMKHFLKKLKPNNFEEIVAANALFRPGPMKNINTYLRRKNGKETINIIHPKLKKVLQPTYGIIVYQEQIMEISNIIANYTLGEGDLLRRSISRKQEDEMKTEKHNFIKRSLENGYSLNIANDVYNLISKYAEYGFNRSHSVSYSIIAYKMAYLKAHFPIVFMKVLLNNVIGSEIKTKEYIYECRKSNIHIIEPNINVSSNEYEITSNSILMPLTTIKNIGINATEIIIKEREKRPFVDIYDFVKRLYGKIINKEILVNLINSGCFNNFGINRNTLITNLDIIINYGELIKDVDPKFALKPEIISVGEYNKKEIMNLEKEIFGFFVSNHPITDLRIKYCDCVEINNLENYFDKYIKIIVYVEKKKTIKTKKGDEMSFLVGSDEMSSIDIVLFPKTHNKNKHIQEGDVIKIDGKVEKRFAKLQIIANNITKLI